MHGQEPGSAVVGHVILLGHHDLSIEEVALENAVELSVALMHLQHLVFIREKTLSVFWFDASNIFGGRNLGD